MPQLREIRADYDRDTIVMYQAYDDTIADAALANGRFVAPFSRTRMTWIKPSFLWLMHRSNWGRKRGQQRTLRVRMLRSGWERALALGVLTSPDGPFTGDPARWSTSFEAAKVHVQWDTERSLRGAALGHQSIQVGIGRHVIEEFVDQWIVGIEDASPLVAKIAKLMRSGAHKEARRALPSERPYPISSDLKKQLWMS